MNELSLRSVVSIDRTTGSFSTIAQEIVVPKEEDTNGRERQTDRRTDREGEREREREKQRKEGEMHFAELSRIFTTRNGADRSWHARSSPKHVAGLISGRPLLSRSI